MNGMRPPGIAAGMLALAVGVTGHAYPQAEMMREQRRDPAYEATLRAIAQDIEALKPDYPQLAEFSVARNFNAPHLHITYDYRVNPPTRTGGWGGAAWLPKEDGITLHIDLHDPKSEQQLHRQPVVPLFRFRDKAVMLLMVEGKATKSLEPAIARIFKDHDVTSVPIDWRGDPVEP
jgi:hypothetical protein